jgi:hypothetical protein
MLWRRFLIQSDKSGRFPLNAGATTKAMSSGKRFRRRGKFGLLGSDVPPPESAAGQGELSRDNRVSGSNGAENPFKGYESSKPDQKYPFPAHFRLIASPFILSESKLAHVASNL